MVICMSVSMVGMYTCLLTRIIVESQDNYGPDNLFVKKDNLGCSILGNCIYKIIFFTYIFKKQKIFYSLYYIFLSNGNVCMVLCDELQLQKSVQVNSITKPYYHVSVTYFVAVEAPFSQTIII